MPCTWTDPTSGVTVTLLTVGGFSSARRLSAGFVIESETSLEVAIDKGSEARSVERFPFASRNHRLGTQNGDAELVETRLPGMTLAGGIDFFRADTATATLSELVIELYQAAPVPRWRPRFLNIPAVTP